MNLFSLQEKRPIYRVHIAHALRGMALSVVSIYVPIYLLTRGYSLTEVILFYVLFHVVGLLFTLGITTRLINRFGTLFTIKWYYPFQIFFLVLLFLLEKNDIPIWWIAIVGGIAEFTYWIPLNMILLRNADFDKMGSDLATFFALPKILGIAGPIVSALLVPIIGFWWVFLVATVGLLISFIPLAGLSEKPRGEIIHWSRIWTLLKKRKKLFVLEGLDKALEEAEWFWGIYVFFLIGSLSTPGIIGALEAIGGAIFTYIVGSKANKHAYRYVMLGSIILIAISISRMFVETAVLAYGITIIASFAMMLFLVSYFSLIYKQVKKDDEEEFIILREIPTVVGRLIMFSGVLLTLQNPKFFFVLPIVIVGIFLWKSRMLLGK